MISYLASHQNSIKILTHKLLSGLSAQYNSKISISTFRYQERFVEFMKTSVVYKEEKDEQVSKSNSTQPEQVQPAPRASVVITAFSVQDIARSS
mmetsp:Transcript_8963/g.12335  ORF Transcript_8963/g.12335 Transcript_8963/m.12335 type:complete len:94 (+) Transcript_8963:1515-1796(+)